MKVIKNSILFISVIVSFVFCVGEAGAIFLLINPGAAAAGVGEAQVAKADDPYATFYNPAGLGFMEGTEFALQHVNWLPNLADDIFYDFIGVTHKTAKYGTFGGHLIYLNLGDQEATDEYGNSLGQFKSYMMALTGSYGMRLKESAAFGLNFKVYHQKLSDKFSSGTGVGSEVGDPFSTDFAFDIGYLKKFGKNLQHSFGFAVQNIGPPIDFVDSEQADPAPTNMRLGVHATILDNEKNHLSFLFDANKLLVASYPDMDWNGNGIIDEGTKEEHHTDEWYEAILTSWLDDWYYGGDLDLCGDNCASVNLANEYQYDYGDSNLDGRIGGYYAKEFSWVPTQEPTLTTSDYGNEIYVPNFEDFCIEDQAWCWLNDGTLLGDTNNDNKITSDDDELPDNWRQILAANNQEIAYIDLPHDNLGNYLHHESEHNFSNSQYADKYDYQYYYHKLSDVPNNANVYNADTEFENPQLVVCGNPNDANSGDATDANAGNLSECENPQYDIAYTSEYDFDDDEYGIYNVFGDEEKGTGDKRKFSQELKEMIYNFGFEWWYTQYFVMRVGYIYDEEGDIKNPTVGAGIRFNKYGFDFGYTSGDKDHPRANTMFFSLSLGI